MKASELEYSWNGEMSFIDKMLRIDWKILEMFQIGLKFFEAENSDFVRIIE